eukprot:754580-Hanusia_phi.AAC.2
MRATVASEKPHCGAWQVEGHRHEGRRERREMEGERILAQHARPSTEQVDQSKSKVGGPARGFW